jgi:hypothetical protein
MHSHANGELGFILILRLIRVSGISGGMKIFWPSVCLAILSFQTVSASENESYRSRIGLIYDNSQWDDGSNFQEKAVMGIVYLERLNLNSPIKWEAPFLQRVGHVGFIYSQFDIEVFGTDFSESEYLGANFSYMKKGNPYYFNFSYSNIESSTLSDGYNWSIKLGCFPMDHLLASIEYREHETVTFSRYYSIISKYVKANESGGYNLESRLRFKRSERNAETIDDLNLLIKGDYYFNSDLSLGSSISFDFGDTKANEGASIGILTRKFFTESTNLDLAYERFEAKHSEGSDANSITVGLDFRF